MYETVFKPGGEPILFMEHRINIGDSPPVSLPPYRLPPAKKEYHDSPTAEHYGDDRTYHRISQRNYFTGMRKHIQDYHKQYADKSRMPSYKFSVDDRVWVNKHPLSNCA
ncbi:hypothetical protein NPIL_41351 [Nephila pilipes]|uniref:Integrase zinc-binding domain-containing protein n=1 Tax=Nephila pilipes TaxID=299642 RepID=A0A8X6UD32_NEPPI|nr:hypothetical protein NPIL_41351 [Nephila pilipes]